MSASWHRRCSSSALAMRQQTIRKPVTLEGVGLHSGKPARVTLSPAPEDTGIVFRAGGDRIAAAPESVVNSHYATTIGKNGTRIQTIEHLLAAAAGLGIDNLDVEVTGPEIPATDGSAKPFVALLAAAGRSQQSARRRPFTLPYPIRIGSGGRWIHVFPAQAFRISYTLDVDHPAVGMQVLSWTPASERAFVDEVAPARTYGFLKDLGVMRKNGLARGGSLDNAVVVGNRGPINGLRYRDEFVRHKILDLIGDLALLGRPILAHVVARNGGHALNLELVLAIQRALGLERRPAGVAARILGEPDAPARNDRLAPAPGLARI
jgi:UDP-3-O-[3-hydroxymyristoyl] N-acetylglucosamine deacetylase